MRRIYPHSRPTRRTQVTARRILPITGVRRRFDNADEVVDEPTVNSLLQVLRIHGPLPLLAIQLHMHKLGVRVAAGLLHALYEADIVERLDDGRWALEQLVRDRFR